MKALESLPFTIARLHAEYAAGLSPVAVVEEVERRIAAAGDPGIFISVGPIAELKSAAAGLGDFDPGGKSLFGIPIAVKDNIDVAGLPTTASCPDYSYLPA